MTSFLNDLMMACPYDGCLARMYSQHFDEHVKEYHSKPPKIESKKIEWDAIFLMMMGIIGVAILSIGLILVLLK